jgi:hypothetical protein
MDDDERDWPGLRTIGLLLGGGALLLLVVLTFLGGLVSPILSSVGNSLPSGNFGGSTEGPAGEVADPDRPAATDSDGHIADAAAAPPELLIIRTGSLELEVTDLPAAVAEARRHVAAAGGYVSASDESAAGEEARASVVYRIPADRWDAAVAAIRGVAEEVRHAAVQTEAVSAQVIDLGARIANLRASEAALQAIMVQATTIPSVLEVQEELTAIRGEIERLVAQKESLEERAAFGTLTVEFRLPATPAIEEVQRGWDPASDVDRAAGSLIGLGQALASIGIWVGIVCLPILLAFLLIAAVAWRVFRLFRPAGSGVTGESGAGAA